ncbi:hypothetical protein WG68_11100 [Arsukibacterium ikkense]|uniref:catalase n=1 Tax=Arsukibacterium ikkense TaxID=336831 RepID=A0A0M2V3Q9_9GAMM|nr:DJ-1/PfpI family protein [Arsukibacterium ikkense]KKO45266.1 hypothetical protein WG68_11100 [Arsukibacterium ikkense]
MPKTSATLPEPDAIMPVLIALTALSIRQRQIAILIENGVEHASLAALYGALTDAGAIVHLVGTRIGIFVGTNGENIAVNQSLEHTPSVLFDALILPDGNKAVHALATSLDTSEFIKNLYRNGKTILALGSGRQLLDRAAIKASNQDDGVLLANSSDVAGVALTFIKAIAAQRYLAGNHPLQT